MNYKEYPKLFIGASDGAALTVRSFGILSSLDFFKDGSYSAYIVDEKAEIGEHYRLVFEGSRWVRIYDDAGLSFKANSRVIKIYRAGEMGCIVQLINREVKGDAER